MNLTATVSLIARGYTYSALANPFLPDPELGQPAGMVLVADYVRG